MAEISWDDFEKVEIRVGTILSAEDFPKARKPAYKLLIDFGELGQRKSSVQITLRYSREELVGRQVVCVLNFPSRQIADFRSEVLTTGFADAEDAVILAVPDRPVPNGSKLF